MAEAMSDSRRKERTDWLMGRLEDHLIGTERLVRHARELGLDTLADILQEQAESQETLLGDLVTGTAR